MVHVEIFLGGETGEETIGARYQKGFVQIFPSYKFDSKLWTLKEFHFCSIETWLDGICQSYCSTHPWIIPTVNTGGKSIFDDDDSDVSAGDDFDDDEGDQPSANPTPVEDEADMVGGGDGDDEDDPLMESTETKPTTESTSKPYLKKAKSRAGNSFFTPNLFINRGKEKRC